MTPCRLGTHRWPAIAAAPPTVVIALGSTEQHGPHLPLDTDTRIAEFCAGRLVEARADLVLGPTLAIGASGEHDGFAGTLSMGAAAFELVLLEIGRSADAFAGVIWVNAHGGNSAALRAAHARLVAEGRRSLALRCAVAGGDAHAGRTETSMLLAISPEVVSLEAAEAGRTESWAELEAEILAGGVKGVSPNGVLGDPAGANAAEGQRSLDRIHAAFVEAVARWIDD
ncbi:MAG: mycofactocin biosynthesis peptidyl-dipeptidase MftE [Actinobacteria bacterium]|nr:mycofactocin biosynthesis peptidyl-dipeptidase MftE [Actinomycetota bacterium]